MSFDRRIRFAMAVLVSCGAGCQFFETEETTYESFDKARSAGAIGNWLPDWLPPHAINIRERHRVDLPMAWIRFESANNMEGELVEGCVDAVNDDFVNVSALGNEAPRWWPAELATISSENGMPNGWEFFRCDSDLLAVVKEDPANVAYVWRLEDELTDNNSR